MRASICFLLLLPLTLAAQKSDGSSSSSSSSRESYGHKVAVPSAMAARRTSPIVLDAKLDEAAWQKAEPITEFKQIDPE
ncbi:MAG TPA: hypothetical protein VGQ56_02740, partial [Gemmatimonadaceae bacterium]|nr:hypothetical protein [Gemmatimonadaceae bacterium]